MGFAHTVGQGQFWSIFAFIFGRIDTIKDIFWNKLTFKVGLKHRDRGESVYEAERVYGPQYQSATYESILEIDNVRTEHYTTTFRCEAVNKFGAASNDMLVRNCNDVHSMINYWKCFFGSLVWNFSMALLKLIPTIFCSWPTVQWQQTGPLKTLEKKECNNSAKIFFPHHFSGQKWWNFTHFLFWAS